MTEALLISQIALWVLLLVMAGLQLALLRQIGVIHERVAPMGALTLDKGPKEGENAPLFDLLDIKKRRVTVGGASGKSSLIFFLSPSCPVCKKMLPILKSSSRTESNWLDIVLASDGEAVEHERFVNAQGLGEFPYLLSQELGMTYRVGKAPICGVDRRSRRDSRQGTHQYTRAPGEPHPGEGNGRRLDPGISA